MSRPCDVFVWRCDETGRWAADAASFWRDSAHLIGFFHGRMAALMAADAVGALPGYRRAPELDEREARR